MTAEPNLLPCPFCGASKHLYVEHLEGTIIHPAFRVRCDFCGASTEYTDRDCRTAWNTRANLAELQREVEGLRAEVERWKSLHATAYDAFRTVVATERRLEARAERLAEALREIAHAEEGDSLIGQIARAAFNQET